MDLTRSFSPDKFNRALESWQWLGVEDKNPIFTSPFGDVFFRSHDGFWLLERSRPHLPGRGRVLIN
jgi:hypothetical protein